MSNFNSISKYTFGFIIFGIIIVSGCTSGVTIKKPEPIKFEETPVYSVQDDLNKIPKPEIVNPIYVKLEGSHITQLPNATGATHILLAPEEYAKFGGVVKLAKTYKTLILEQEYLVNTYVSQINSLKMLLEMERQKTLNYHELWETTEKLYRAEKWDHNLDNWINRAVIGVLGGAMILLIAL